MSSPISSYGHLTYNTSGDNGKNGANGSSAYYPGATGGNGTVGTNGQHARNLKVTMKTDNGIVFVKGNTQTHQFSLSDKHISISLVAHGGNGGKGGDGGTGGKGAQGKNGADATSYSTGSNGEPGGRGQVGGNGAFGGNGGNGGDVTLQVRPEDTDLLMLIQTPDVRGGAAGPGGKAGAGGPGGDGGRGGSSYSWSTYETRYTTGADGRSQTETYVQSHYHAGGSNGGAGPQGYSGNKGKDGLAGRDGSFNITVGTNTYEGPYDLSVISCNLADSNNDQVIEPGEKVSVKLRVKNTGKMPTPKNQKIRLELNNNQWVRFNPCPVIQIPVVLAPEERFTPERPLEFRVPEAQKQTGTPLKVTGTVDFRATVERVERQFPYVDKQKKNFVVRYPVELEEITGVRSISANEEALLTIKVKNVSSRELGCEGEQHRPVNLRYNVIDNNQTTGSDVTFYTRDRDEVSGRLGLQKSVSHLPAAEKEKLTGSLKFSNPLLKPYSKVKVAASLELGSLERPTEEPVKTIQQREFEIQLAEAYKRNSDADFLLVTNANTTLKEMQNWQRLSDQLGLSMSTWNSSLYNGISLFHKNETRKTHLANDFKEKTIVFLNYDSANGKTSVDTLPSFELSKAASHDHGIKTYILGKGKINKDQFYPDQEAIKNIEPIVAEAKYFFKKEISYEKLEKSAKRYAETLRRKAPEKSFTVLYEYDPQKLPTSLLRKRYQLGRLTACPAPREGMFSYFNMPPKANNQASYVTSQSNVYGLLKSLPLQKKIELIQKRNYTDLLKQAILSDLVDEHKIFSQDRWTGKWSKSELKKELTCLQQVLNSSYADKETQELIQQVLIEFRAFACRMPRKVIDLCIYRRQRLLASATKEMIDGLFKKIFHLDSSHWKKEYDEISADFEATKREYLWKKYQHPGISRLPQYNSVCANRVIDKKDLEAVYSNPKKSTVAEGQHCFETQEERLQALLSLERDNKTNV